MSQLTDMAKVIVVQGAELAALRAQLAAAQAEVAELTPEKAKEWYCIFARQWYAEGGQPFGSFDWLPTVLNAYASHIRSADLRRSHD